MSQQANDLLMGSGGPPAAKFPNIGDMVKGQITDLAVTQQREYKTAELKFWNDGSPMMQAVITLQTENRDNGDDDGRRRFFVDSKAKREAVRQAVIDAGAKQLEVGGTLAAQYYADGESTGVGNPPKLFRAEYKFPVIGVGLLGNPTEQAKPATSLLADEAPF